MKFEIFYIKWQDKKGNIHTVDITLDTNMIIGMVLGGIIVFGFLR